MAYTEPEVGEIIRAGEGPHAEFKVSPPGSANMARIIAAFANSGGGQLLIGVSDDGHGNHAVTGVDIQRALAALKPALARISPPPDVRAQEVSVEGRSVLVVSIEPSRSLVLSEGAVFLRRGDVTQLADAESLMATIAPNEPQIELMAKLERFALAIDEQGRLLEQLQKGNGWHNKLFWAVTGAIIGFPISLLTLLM